MFICPNCSKPRNLTVCSCGYTVPNLNGVWQLTDAPDAVKTGDGDLYIGYEEIGEAYSGSRKYIIEEADSLAAREIAELTGKGVFLDLACGDGCLTLPCARNGTKVIAGDISNKMIGILKDRADHFNISLDNVTLCRINALNIPLADESVDTVVANSVLHLISNPQKVLDEIYRVLKTGGAFVCLEDAPGEQDSGQVDNSLYFEIVNTLYKEYWERLGQQGIYSKKYSWKFDRESACSKLFASRETQVIQHRGKYETKLSDGFLPRFLGRGFSDQTDVPKEVHEAVTELLMKDFRVRYGGDFVFVPYVGQYSDILLTVYRK